MLDDPAEEYHPPRLTGAIESQRYADDLMVLSTTKDSKEGLREILYKALLNPSMYSGQLTNIVSFETNASLPPLQYFDKPIILRKWTVIM